MPVSARHLSAWNGNAGQPAQRTLLDDEHPIGAEPQRREQPRGGDLGVKLGVAPAVLHANDVVPRPLAVELRRRPSHRLDHQLALDDVVVVPGRRDPSGLAFRFAFAIGIAGSCQTRADRNAASRWSEVTNAGAAGVAVTGAAGPIRLPAGSGGRQRGEDDQQGRPRHRGGAIESAGHEWRSGVPREQQETDDIQREREEGDVAGCRRIRLVGDAAERGARQQRPQHAIERAAAASNRAPREG